MKRIDSNHREIVKGLRDAGVSVQSLAECGRGVPDLLLGWRSQNYLVELKDGNKSPSRKRLTEDEQNWHAMWRGQVAVVETLDEALRVLNIQ